MRLAAATFRLHRWLAWLVGVQVLIWICGGLAFSWLPFKSWVKSGDSLRPPQLQMPADWAAKATPALRAAAAAAEVAAITAVTTSQGAAWRISLRGQPEPVLALADGAAWSAPDPSTVRRFAQSLYKGPGGLTRVTRLSTVPRRLQMVDEVAGRRELWRVSFDDALGTRLYIDAGSGEFVAMRNEAWVWYDFFWRLHIMDYGGGEDFNSPLLRVAALLSMLLALAGAVLAALALRRRLRRWRRPHQPAAEHQRRLDEGP
jgi:PepSY-associated TM region